MGDTEARDVEFPPSDVSGVVDGFAAHDYLADEGLATVVFLALRMRRPLLLEGDAGVGKTEVAKVLAAWSGARIIRLQCYEGIDAAQALYEWDYPRQLLHLRAAEAAGAVSTGDALEHDLYDERFLVRRPLLEALDAGSDAVLLVDEIDRADDEFEAFLLEILSEWAVTIPEFGTVRAPEPPMVVLTSNRTRDLHDALKRRCLYHWVDHPDPVREAEIIRRRVPAATDRLARQVARAVASLRAQGLYKPPGVAESIDWAESLVVLHADELSVDVARSTIGTVLKYREDQERIGLDEVVASAREVG